MLTLLNEESEAKIVSKTCASKTKNYRKISKDQVDNIFIFIYKYMKK